jgi:beta-N-acetylhexosaminidase
VSTGRETLRAREWLPFARAFAAGARAVMSAHVLVPALDPELPATLSPRILRDVLREELGFAGVCFTDCLEMEGVAARFGTARAGVMALAAGADALLVSHDLTRAEAVRDAIVAAVNAGELPLARVEEAAARVAVLRREHATADSGTVDSLDADDVAREIARRAIVHLRGELLLAPERPVTIVSFEGAASDGIATAAAERPSLNLALRRRRMRSELLRVPLEPEPEMLETLLDVVRGQAARTLVVLTRRAHLHAAQQDAVRALLAAVPEALVVAMLEPFDAACFPQARNVACCFSDEITSVEALADVLAGRSVASGRLPVRLDYSFA